MKPVEKFSLQFHPSFINTLPFDFEIRISKQPIKQYYKLHLCVLAEFSSKIRLLLLNDPCKRWIEYPEPDPSGCMQKLINYMYGEEVAINYENVWFLNTAAAFFDNQHLLDTTSHYIQQFGIQNDIFQKLRQPNPLYVLPQINLVAMKFDTLQNRPEMMELPISIYDEILRLKDINYNSEESLFQWINTLVKKHGPEYVQLFAHVIIEDLSSPSMHELYSRITPDLIGGALWAAIRNRLMYSVETEESPHAKHWTQGPGQQQSQYGNIQGYQGRPQYNNNSYNQNFVSTPKSSHYQEFPKLPDSHFNGIFQGLTNMCGKNPCSEKIVSIDGGGGPKSRFLPRLLEYNDLDPWWNNYNGSRFTKEDQWIEITFYRHRVILTGYTFASPMKYANSSQPRSWKILGSNDGNNWDVIDEVVNSDEMNSPTPIAYFAVKKRPEPYTQFRIEQYANQIKKPQSTDIYQFCLNALEFFGLIEEIHN